MITAYSARASYGATPAYIAWKLNIRCSRSSCEERGHPAPEAAEPAESDEAGAGPPAAHEVERRVEVGVDEVRHLDAVQVGQPVGEAAERRRLLGAGERRISSVIASRPWRTWSTEPSWNVARYIGSTGRSRMWSAMSAPAAANTSASSPGIVSTVGPLSSRNPSRSISPARPPGRQSRSTTVTSCPSPTRWALAASPPRPAPTTTTRIRRPAPATNEASAASSSLASAVRSMRSRAATASAVRVAMCRSSASRAPVSTITVLDRCRPRHRRARRRRRGRAPPLAGVGGRHRAGQQRRRLPLAQVVADGLAGHGAVAERADDVVAHLEGVAERQPVGAERRAPARRAGPARPARRRRATVARSCTCRSCSGRCARP